MRILIAALLSAALIWLPAKTEPSDINNIVHETANVEQARKSATEEVAPLQEKTPEPPKDLSETVATPPPVKVVEPAPKKKQGCETYRPLLEQYNWDVRTALAVMQAESGCNPTALSPTRDRGLMQINAVHAAKVNGNLELLYDPATNIRVAYSVYLSQGWNAWSAYKSGKHLKFL